MCWWYFCEECTLHTRYHRWYNSPGASLFLNSSTPAHTCLTFTRSSYHRSCTFCNVVVCATPYAYYIFKLIIYMCVCGVCSLTCYSLVTATCCFQYHYHQHYYWMLPPFLFLHQRQHPEIFVCSATVVHAFEGMAKCLIFWSRAF